MCISWFSNILSFVLSVRCFFINILTSFSAFVDRVCNNLCLRVCIIDFLFLRHLLRHLTLFGINLNCCVKDLTVARCLFFFHHCPFLTKMTAVSLAEAPTSTLDEKLSMRYWRAFPGGMLAVNLKHHTHTSTITISACKTIQTSGNITVQIWIWKTQLIDSYWLHFCWARMNKRIRVKTSISSTRPMN